MRETQTTKEISPKCIFHRGHEFLRAYYPVKEEWIEDKNCVYCGKTKEEINK